VNTFIEAFESNITGVWMICYSNGHFENQFIEGLQAAFPDPDIRPDTPGNTTPGREQE